jgi:carbon-monoxide dehydrogenase large subunit
LQQAVRTGRMTAADADAKLIGYQKDNRAAQRQYTLDMQAQQEKAKAFAAAASHDPGRAINPQIVEGQLQGGLVQGIGAGLMEEVVYDDDAQLVTGSFMDYAMPRANMLPNFEIALEEVPCKTNPIGVKGIGESGTIGAPPVVINAIIDALGPLGIDRIDMPATPSRVWQAIQSAKGAG